MESFVRHLYRYKDKDIRKKKFDEKVFEKKKVIDLSLLPHCQSTLYLQILHFNCRKDLEMFLLNTVKWPTIMENSWRKNDEIGWVDDTFPDDIMEILVDQYFGKGSMELNLDPQNNCDDENIDD